MRKSANIQSVEEAIKRLQEGEIFYNSYHKIFYDKNCIIKGYSPFRVGDSAIMGIWDCYKSWEIEVKWQENIPEVGVLCWVSDTDENSKSEWDIIKEYCSGDTFPFSGRSEIWKYATPVQPEDYERVFKKCFI